MDAGARTEGTPYDAVADWYDRFADGPLFTDLIHPGIVALCGEVRDAALCDVACGTGALTRLLAGRDARVTGVDLSEPMLAIARRYEAEEPLGITYVQADAQSLTPLEDGQFDLVTCSHGLTDILDLADTVAAIRRVLRPGGMFVFSIPHPCFQTPHYEWTVLPDGRTGEIVAGYFEERYWRSENTAGVRYRVGAYHRRLGTYLTALADAGFRLERMEEPQAQGAVAVENPGYAELPAVILVRMRRDMEQTS